MDTVRAVGRREENEKQAERERERLEQGRLRFPAAGQINEPNGRKHVQYNCNPKFQFHGQTPHFPALAAAAMTSAAPVIPYSLDESIKS